MRMYGVLLAFIGVGCSMVAFSMAFGSGSDLFVFPAIAGGFLTCKELKELFLL